MNAKVLTLQSPTPTLTPTVLTQEQKCIGFVNTYRST